MKKNVLFIIADDLRPDINCFGKEKLITPNLDKLSEQSTIFENCYCQVPQCMGSRASLFSGIRPKYGDWKGLKTVRFNNELTMPQAFMNSGYETVSIGKSYHFNHEDDEAWTRRYQHTFYDEKHVCDGYCSGYQLEENKQRIKEFYRRFRGTKEQQAEWTFPDIIECVDTDDSSYIDFQTASYTIDELVGFSQSKKNFFLTMGLYRPHLPWAAPKKYFDMYDKDNMDIADNPFFPKNGIGKSTQSDFVHYGDTYISETYGDFGRYKDDDFPVMSEEKQREYIHAYCACVTFMDVQIGRVMDALEALGLANDTIVVFAADNGWHLGEHKLWAKTTQFEESTHVPLMIRDIGTTKGESTQSLAELLDIYPTLCELTGVPKAPHVDGVSLVEVLKDKDVKVNSEIFSTYTSSYTVRSETHRLTYYAGATPQGDVLHIPSEYKLELFDLVCDPKENINIYPDMKNSQVTEHLKDLLIEKFDIIIEE